MTRAALFGASRAWVAQLTRVLARFEPCAVTAVHDPAQLGAVISGERPTLLVTDHDGRRFDSRAALGVMRYLAPDVPVVVYATAGSEEVAVAAIKGGAADYLPAPADDAELQAVLRETIDAPRQAPRIRSHDRFADLLDHLDVGVYRTNADGMLLAANPAMARILRQPTVSALLDMSRARPAGTHAGALIRQDGAIKGVFVNATERLPLPTGEVVIQGDGRAIHDDRGELVGFEGYIRDVTNRECARKAATLRAMMLDQAQHAVIGVDEDLAVSYWNKGAERMLGWTSAEVLGGEAVWLAGQLMSAGTVASVRPSSPVPVPGLARRRSGIGTGRRGRSSAERSAWSSTTRQPGRSRSSST